MITKKYKWQWLLRTLESEDLLDKYESLFTNNYNACILMRDREVHMIMRSSKQYYRVMSLIDSNIEYRAFTSPIYIAEWLKTIKKGGNYDRKI